MPLTGKGSKIMRSMKKTYGGQKGEGVFYASIKSGTITGVEGDKSHPHNPGQGQNVLQEMHDASCLINKKHNPCH